MNVVCQSSNSSSSGVDSSSGGIGNTTTSTSATTPPTSSPTTSSPTLPPNIDPKQQYVIQYRVYGDYNQLTTESRQSQLSTLIRLIVSISSYSHLFISIAARPIPTPPTQRASIEHWILINGKELDVKNNITSTFLKDAFIATLKSTTSTINQRVNTSFEPIPIPVNLTLCTDGKWHKDCTSSNTTPATSWSDSYALWTGILAVAGSSFAILGITFVLSYSDLSRGPRNVIDHDKIDIDELPVIASLTKATSSPSMRDTSTRVRINKPALQAARWNDSTDEKSSESSKHVYT